ncbi:hypothetical protein ACFVWF_29655 [Rhodococcus qingshengii]|uniref:hypothetical protein n=1 Tax=Rhodococcus qingshengii TaxID=334542 RepID=UPI0036DA1D84
MPTLQRGCFPDPGNALARQDLMLITLLSTMPEIQKLAYEDTARWDDARAKDDPPPSIYEVVMTSAYGAACSAAWGFTGEAFMPRLAGHLDLLTRAV